jgi:hypothetical protein
LTLIAFTRLSRGALSVPRDSNVWWSSSVTFHHPAPCASGVQPIQK